MADSKQFGMWWKGSPVIQGGDGRAFNQWWKGAPVLQVSAPVVLDRLGRIPLEFGQVVLRTGIIPVESLGTLLRNGHIPVEMLGALVHDGHIPLEHLGTLVRDGQMPVEVVGTLVRLGLIPVEFTGVAAFALARSGVLPVESAQGVAPFIFANWLAAGGGAPVWWPTTLYSYYPQQPLFRPGDKPAKHLRPRRRARARDRAPRPTEALRRDDEYDGIVRMLYRSFMAPRPRMLFTPVHPRVVETVMRSRLPTIVQVSEIFVHALREDAELLELGLL